MAVPGFGLGVYTGSSPACLPQPPGFRQQNARALLTLELHGSTYMQIFSSSVIVLCDLWLVESMDMGELHI